MLAIYKFVVILQKKYPSALNAFERIVVYGKGKKIVLFLDYDGTLSPIVDEPDNAIMSDQVISVQYLHLKKGSFYLLGFAE